MEKAHWQYKPNYRHKKLLLDNFERWCYIHHKGLSGQRMRAYIAKLHFKKELDKTLYVKLIYKFLDWVTPYCERLNKFFGAK